MNIYMTLYIFKHIVLLYYCLDHTLYSLSLHSVPQSFLCGLDSWFFLKIVVL